MKRRRNTINRDITEQAPILIKLIGTSLSATLSTHIIHTQTQTHSADPQRHGRTSRQTSTMPYPHPACTQKSINAESIQPIFYFVILLSGCLDFGSFFASIPSGSFTCPSPLAHSAPLATVRRPRQSPPTHSNMLRYHRQHIYHLQAEAISPFSRRTQTSEMNVA